MAWDFFVCHCINFILKIFQSEAMTACQAIPKQAKNCFEMGFEQTIPNKFLESFTKTSGSSRAITNQGMFPRTMEIERSNQMIEYIMKHFRKSVCWRTRQRKALRYCISWIFWWFSKRLSYITGGIWLTINVRLHTTSK